MAECMFRAQHRLLMITTWCDECLRWHSRLSLQRRVAPSSRLWSNDSTVLRDGNQLQLELGWPPILKWSDLSELQRLFVEEQAGIQRLF